jgi:SpoVK/Ycf46/Vps4 family AAA+-type ATPase
VAACTDEVRLPAALRSPGRLDAVVTLLAPGSSERERIIRSELKGRPVVLPLSGLQAGVWASVLAVPVVGTATPFLASQGRTTVCVDALIQAVADRADGYNALDLRILVDRAMHSASVQRLALSSPWQSRELLVSPTDLEDALNGVAPSSSWVCGKSSQAAGGVQVGDSVP